MDTVQREKENTPEGRRNRHLAMLSHDLKSALTGVIGGLRQIDIAKLDPKNTKFREGALASAIEASRLLDGILDIEAIEAGNFEINIETTNLESFLAELHRRWTARAEWKDLALKVYMEGNLPKTVDLDRGRLSRVLGNLIDNAIKYTENGKVELSVHADDANTLAFTVRDDGPGFSEEALDSLFQFRGRPDSSTKPGSGIGLYISQSLLSQMGGEVKIGNRVAGGTEAVVLVQTDLGKNAAEAELSTASVSVFPTTKLPDLSNLHVLLAEDNITNQLVVTQMLDAMGAKFEIASDGVEALEKFELFNFDVLLLDIEMPRLSGLDVIRSVRARKDAQRNKTIIALTAYAMREHRERIAAAGADGLIAKPILGIEDFGIDILNHYNRVTSETASHEDIPAEATENSDAGSLIDFEVYESLEKSIGSETMNELLSKVLTDLSSVKHGIETGLATEDVKKVGSSSHVLISVAGAIGAVSTQSDAQALNKACHQNDWSIVTLHAEACLTKITELLKFAEGKIHQ